jgi:hypothetical protein
LRERLIPEQINDVGFVSMFNVSEKCKSNILFRELKRVQQKNDAMIHAKVKLAFGFASLPHK